MHRWQLSALDSPLQKSSNSGIRSIVYVRIHNFKISLYEEIKRFCRIIIFSWFTAENCKSDRLRSAYVTLGVGKECLECEHSTDPMPFLELCANAEFVGINPVRIRLGNGINGNILIDVDVCIIS